MRRLRAEMFTDLHCHLLHAIDDGPADLDGAIEMARALVDLGFGAVAPSPHARGGFPGAEVAQQRRAELAEALARAGVALRLHPGAENYLDAEFLERELAGQGRHVNDTRYALVETPYESVVPALPDILFRLRRKAIRPLLAHPERCAEFQEPGRAEEAVRTGGLLQLDLGSLTNKYGRAVRRTALRLLGARLYAVAATDLHGPEDARRWVGDAIRALEDHAGEAELTRLLADNPARVLRGEELLE